MKSVFLLLFIIVSTTCYGQIVVDKAGDGWDLKVDSALNLIEKTDSNAHNLIHSVCYKIQFWNGCYSTNDGEHDIIISTGDIKLGSINNLAAVIVHESVHLYLSNRGVELITKVEENLTYRYELDFINKLPNPEPWLIHHAQQQIINTQ